MSNLPPPLAPTPQTSNPNARSETKRPLPLSTKIASSHLERIAIIYVRQSSTKQVEENIESTRMQYQLAERANLFGWSTERIDIIDDDLGVSGRTIEGRPGFQRLLAEVSLEHVGIVFGIEMSRLARSCRDWHQLLELCSVFGTLLADADGVYDPRDHNDRLLLGLKGTMSEAELHVLQGRLRAGQLNKARRGEYFTHAPIGYVRTENSLALEPDEQARETVQLVFDKFAELGSMSAVMKFLVINDVKIGVRDHRGVNKGQLQWRRPNQATILGMLHHPVYAGAYVYGRRESNPRKVIPGRRGTGRRWANSDDWDVLLHDRLPAYITWDQWEKNQKTLRENSSKYGNGAPRGTSLIAGRTVCGRCGCRMSISYAGRSNARFTCDMSRNHRGTKQCQALNAHPLHELVESQLMQALEPASIELSLQAANTIEAERQVIEKHHRQTVERATYESELARRRYEAVEPENRLVVAELERRWDASLLTARQAEESLDRFRRQQPTRLTPREADAIRALATDIPELWQQVTTSGIDRQTIFRALVDHVEVEVIGETERVRVTIHWHGGFTSHHEIRRAVGHFDKLESAAEIRGQIIDLKRSGYTHGVVAERLNAMGFHSASGRPFTTPIVSSLCRRFRREGTDLSPAQSPTNNEDSQNDLWTLTALADRLGIKRETLSTWRRRGWVLADRNGYRWLFRANATELKRLQKLTDYKRRGLKKTPTELTTPNEQKGSKSP